MTFKTLIVMAFFARFLFLAFPETEGCLRSFEVWYPEEREIIDWPNFVCHFFYKENNASQYRRGQRKCWNNMSETRLLLRDRFDIDDYKGCILVHFHFIVLNWHSKEEPYFYGKLELFQFIADLFPFYGTYVKYFNELKKERREHIARVQRRSQNCKPEFYETVYKKKLRPSSRWKKYYDCIERHMKCDYSPFDKYLRGYRTPN